MNRATRADTDGGISSLYEHLKLSEGLRLEAYPDPGDKKPTVGYGAHEIDGVPVKMGQKITEEQALRTMEADVELRANRLKTFIPGWDSMDDGTKFALIDVSFGRNDVLYDKKGCSQGLHRDLRAAGSDTDLLREAVKKHYPSYRNPTDKKTLQGMQNRRIMGMKTFFGEDFDYDGKVWDNKRGFVKANVAKARRSAEAGGDAGEGSDVEAAVEGSGTAAPTGGTRIVINPTTFKNQKDALCVAFNERFRIAMEQYGWEPQSVPTEKQRKFFADTAYADDEVMLRRTIIARILVLDTSVDDPTTEQIGEALGFLGEFAQRERPTNDWEASAIGRLQELLKAAYATV